jgi:hypothetical protein
VGVIALAIPGLVQNIRLKHPHHQSLQVKAIILAIAIMALFSSQAERVIRINARLKRHPPV